MVGESIQLTVTATAPPSATATSASPRAEPPRAAGPPGPADCASTAATSIVGGPGRTVVDRYPGTPAPRPASCGSRATAAGDDTTGSPHGDVHACWHGDT